jgi:MFS family permease
MRERLSICLGIFSVMALSNAIVPVLPAYAEGSALQSAIYSAYFLGAFLMTLPAGLLSDRYGRVPVMRTGLLVTMVSGFFLTVFTVPAFVIASRFLEGIGAGLFVAASMAYVNSLPDHAKMSGYFMATLNLGLVLGLVAGGVLAVQFHNPSAGILFFAAITITPAVFSMYLTNSVPIPQLDPRRVLSTLLSDYRWLWFSSLVLIGSTGAVTALYPAFSGLSPDIVGIWISGMSIATVVAVLIVSRFNLDPVPAIRNAAILMACGVMLSFFTPLGFLFIGALAGVVMIAQMAFLAKANDRQGAAMGLFSTTSYLGMSLLPFLAGVVAESTSFFIAFCGLACIAFSVVPTIGRCRCRNANPERTSATEYQ